MFCENCGNPITDKDIYCMRCGARINRETNGRKPVPVNHQWSGDHNIQTPVNNQWPGNQSTPTPANMSSKSGGIRNVYFIDFLCRLFSKENIPLCIYLATISIALSPIGEFIVRFQTGCKKIKDPEVMNRLEPLFYEVYQKAKMQEPLISDSVRLYMNEDESENAFATGRRTICVTRGLLNLPDEAIKATLGHEFGHLAHKDTDRCLLVVLGNTAISGICVFIEMIALFFNIVSTVMSIFTRNEDSFFVAMFGVFSSVVMLGIVRCSFAGGSYKPRSYELFVKDDMGEKK